MRFLALDVGEKRIGVARGDDSTRIAIPVGFIEAGDDKWAELTRIADFYGTKRLIVGLPRNNQGQETAQSAYVREFVRQLVKRVPGVKVKFQDETLTSVLAEERLKQSGKPYQKGDIDAEAAAIILQDFLERSNYSTGVAGTTSAAEATEMNPGTTPNGLKTPNLAPNFSTTPSEAANLAPQAHEQPELGKETTMSKKQRKQAQKAQKRVQKTAKKAKKDRSVGSVIGGIITTVLIIGVIGVAGAFGFLKLRDQRRAEQEAALAAAAEPEVFDFMVKPGETIYDIQTNLAAAGYSKTEVEQALAADYDFPMLQGRTPGATLEGYLFGETKQFYKSAPATEVVEFFLQEMQETIDENNLEAQFAAQGLTLEEGITLASVVQKEANPGDMPTVAQVFLSRLAEGIPLGSDVTVSYAVDTVDPGRDGFSNNQAALGIDSCYNTRLYGGLPCGPISNPGIDALLAVANPSDTSYLYFLTGDDGLMYYSYTEDQHIENAAEHCQDLCQVSL